MAEESNDKRRKVARMSLKVELYVPNDEAPRVGGDEFEEWKEEVVTIFDIAHEEIAFETGKFFFTQKPLKMHAVIEPRELGGKRRTEIHLNAALQPSSLRSKMPNAVLSGISA